MFPLRPDVPGAALALGGPAKPPPHAGPGKPRPPVTRSPTPSPSPTNNAPDRPVDVHTADPWAECSTSSPAMLRSTTPTLSAVLSDPDGGSVEAVFEVRDASTAQTLWSATTAPQGSGAAHAVTVPDGLLQDGSTYEWAVRGLDAAGATSPEVRCRVAVDVTPPGESQVTAVPGAGAVYAEDVASGGVGVPGAFLLEAPGSDDVVAFLYGFDGTAHLRADLEPGTAGATVTWTPTTAGPHTLTVQAVDAAGNVGPSRHYTFTVAFASSTPRTFRWTFDEGAGTTATDDTGAEELVLTASTTWTAGLQEELWGTPDGALLLDEPTDGAEALWPMLDTTRSWSVAAFVRADAAVAGPVVRQDADGTDAFRLGTSTTCEDGLEVCWALTVGGAGGASTTVTSSVPVVPGAWVGLVAVRDAVQGTVRLDVCDFGTADEPGSPLPVQGRATPAAAGVPPPARSSSVVRTRERRGSGP